MLQQAPFWLQLAADRIHVFSVELAVPPHSVGRTLILQNPASLVPLRNLRNLCHHDVFPLTRLYVASLVLSFHGVLITVALGMRRTSCHGDGGRAHDTSEPITSPPRRHAAVAAQAVIDLSTVHTDS